MIHSNINKDIIIVEDEVEKTIFHFKVFCELLKECIAKYGNVAMDEAERLVGSFHPLQIPIKTTIEVVFFSHESIYHWAMLALYGKMYWIKHPECKEFPNDYEEWIESALARYSLTSCYEFIDKNNKTEV